MLALRKREEPQTQSRPSAIIATPVDPKMQTVAVKTFTLLLARLAHLYSRRTVALTRRIGWPHDRPGSPPHSCSEARHHFLTFRYFQCNMAHLKAYLSEEKTHGICTITVTTAWPTISTRNHTITGFLPRP